MSITTEAPLVVASAQGAYPVDFLASEGDLVALVTATPDARFAVDAKILALYPSFARAMDPRLVHAIDATEDEKSLRGVEKLATFLQETDSSKRTHLVVVGGGIVQDIAAFCAYAYYRGIAYTLVPTTLLSMADSCIGAKCGVNLGYYKNQLGFFASPARVAIYRAFTATLAFDDLRSGFGEVLKLAITDSAEAFGWFERSLVTGFASVDLDEAIRRSLETKRRVIEIDEYEANLRKTLNYGHSFSHAIEGLTDHAVPHGLGVAWGVDVANYVSMRRGFLAAETYTRVHALIAKNFSFDVDRRSYDAARICGMLKRDKKAASGSITLVLPRALGELALVPTAVDGELEAIVAEYLERENVFGPMARA